MQFPCNKNSKTAINSFEQNNKKTAQPIHEMNGAICRSKQTCEIVPHSVHSVALIPNVSVHRPIAVRQFSIVLSLIRTLTLAFVLPHLAASLKLTSEFRTRITSLNLLVVSLNLIRCNIELNFFSLLQQLNDNRMRNETINLGHF